MKKYYAIFLVFAVGTGIFAQEAGEGETPPQASGVPGEVKLGMGTLNIHGLVLTGVEAKALYQEGALNLGQNEWISGKWKVDAINPGWGENRFDLYLDYSFLNYGVFLAIRYQSWGINTWDDNGWPDARYAFFYAKFLQDKVKVSLGKLTNEIYIMQETRLWKTDGPWDTFAFTEDAKDDEHMSLRLEVKPLPQLTVGAQYFFALPDGVGLWDKYWDNDFAESGVWKEVGLAAEWKSDLFNAVLGLRFDSLGDTLTKWETGTYLRGYYGDSEYLNTDAAPTAGPRYKYADEAMRQMTFPDAPTDYTPVFTADPAFDGSTRMFFGFNVKAVKNMDIIGQAGFFNVGAWDKFGYARMNELVRYNNLGIKNLGLGLIMSQEFYGNDVFPDDMMNVPFITFAPEISYAPVDVPGFLMKGTLTATFGVCPDVLENYVKVKPAITVGIGAFFVDLFYEMEHTSYTDKALGRDGNLIKPATIHKIGLAGMLMF
jgi:hypothetical protein